jgi:hypothetical protein
MTVRFLVVVARRRVVVLRDAGFVVVFFFLGLADVVLLLRAGLRTAFFLAVDLRFTGFFGVRAMKTTLGPSR